MTINMKDEFSNKNNNANETEQRSHFDTKVSHAYAPDDYPCSQAAKH